VPGKFGSVGARRPLWVLSIAVAVIVSAVACGDEAGEPRPGEPAGIAAAEAYARERGADVRPRTQFLQSSRDRDWALVLGRSGRRGLWSVWLHVEQGRWQPRHIVLDGRGETRPAEVPCDIKPPFSEPDCPPQ
jgi:hypothetical protein